MKNFDFNEMLRYQLIDAHFHVQSGGGQYFFVKRVDGVLQIFKSAFSNAWPHQLTFFPEGITEYTVSPDGRMLAVIVNRGGSEQNPLALVDTTTGQAIYALDIPDVQSGAVIWRKDGSGFLFRSNLDNGVDFKIYEYLLFQARYELLIDTRGWALPLDCSRDGDSILYLVRRAVYDQDLYVYERGTGDSIHVSPHEGFATYEARFRSAGQLYILSNEGNHDFARLYHLDIDSGQRRPLGPGLDRDLSGLEVSPSGRYVLFSANKDGYSSLHMIDGWLNTELPMPETKGIITNYFFHDELEIVFTYEYPKRAPDIYHWSCRTQNVTQLTWVCYQGLSPNRFVQPRLLRYESFDGLLVPAFMYLPEDYREGERIPFIVNFHGGPEGQFRPLFWKQYQYLLSLGIGVFAPNVRGSRGYGAEYMSLDNYKKRMDAVRDGVEAGRWLVNQGYTSPEMLGALGGSYGGFMVLSVITEAPGLWAAAVDRVGIANLETFLENTRPYRRAIREAEYGPLTDRDFLREISPIYKMDKVEAPLLVVHGANDPRVPLGEAEQVVKALEERGKVVEKLIFEDEGHGISKLANQVVYNERMIRFFLKHLRRDNGDTGGGGCET